MLGVDIELSIDEDPVCLARNEALGYAIRRVELCAEKAHELPTESSVNLFRAPGFAARSPALSHLYAVRSVIVGSRRPSH